MYWCSGVAPLPRCPRRTRIPCRRARLWRIIMVKTAMRGAVAALVASLLAACAVGPNYHEPKMDVPAQFSEVNTPQYAITDSSAQFNKLFGDARLAGLVND